MSKKMHPPALELKRFLPFPSHFKATLGHPVLTVECLANAATAEGPPKGPPEGPPGQFVTLTHCPGLYIININIKDIDKR